MSMPLSVNSVVFSGHSVSGGRVWGGVCIGDGRGYGGGGLGVAVRTLPQFLLSWHTVARNNVISTVPRIDRVPILLLFLFCARDLCVYVIFFWLYHR